MSAVKLVAIFAENKLGQTARITKILADAQVNIRCISLASTGAYGVMKLLVNNPDLACQALKHEGFAATLIEVLAVEMPDRPGALHTVAECLAQNNVNLDNTSGFVVNDRAILVIEVHNIGQARDVLQRQGLQVLTQQVAL